LNSRIYNKQLVSKSVDHLENIIAHTNKVKRCIRSLYGGKRGNPKGMWWVKESLKMEVVVSFAAHLK
jgi:hypothetical protein